MISTGTAVNVQSKKAIGTVTSQEKPQSKAKVVQVFPPLRMAK